jgi:methanogenic corrinoid protein MtbC1
MQNYYTEFLSALEKEDREKCLEIVFDFLSREKAGIPALYNDILRPALNGIGDENEPQKIRIWKEHVRSSIVRTVIECCFPYVIKERDRGGIQKKNKSVIVICPDGEYHELGARMASDFFTLAGYDAVFIGSSTPRDEFVDVVNVLKPGYIALSVTNHFNLVSAKRIIENIRAKGGSKVKILAGGHAFSRNPEAWREIGADVLVNTYEDIKKLGEGE